MPRVTYNQTNFTAGEISPRLYGRVDIARYQNGAKRLENVIPLIHGGVKRRDGTKYVNAAKYSDKLCRLIPYVFNDEQSYMLEIGDGYMRVFDNTGFAIMDGLVPYEISTSFTEDMLRDLNFVQGADSLFIAHKSLPIQRIQRFDDDLWVIEDAPFVTKPFAEVGHRPNATLTLSASTVGAGRTFTASGSSFLSSDIGREITSSIGKATITGYTSATVVTCTITKAFTSTSIAAYAWTINGSPQSVISPSATNPVGEKVLLDASRVVNLAAEKTITDASVSGTTITIEIVAHGYANGDLVEITGFKPNELNGEYKIKGVTADTFQYNFKRSPYDDVDPTVLGVAKKNTPSTPLDTWRSTDVGSMVRINRGIVRITEYVSAILVKGIIEQELDSDIGAIAGSWSLEPSVWNAIDGYPRALTLFEQRLFAGGSPNFPQTVWASRIGEYLNFQLGINDDDAMSFTISSDQINPVVHLSQMRVIAALTYGGEFTLRGGLEKPITPTNIQIKGQTTSGCKNVRPCRIGNELFFVQRNGKKLMAMGYQAGGIDGDDYGVNDLSVLAEHILGDSCIDMAYQQEPESILWCLRSDGVLASLTIDRAQDVIAWARHTTQGEFESVACIPSSNGDQVWVVVQREINGNTVRYIEVMDPNYPLDCGYAQVSFPADSVLFGADHLEGEQAEILADGVVMPNQTVVGGEITLSRPANTIKIGLSIPVAVELLTPEIQTGTGSAQGNSMRTGEVTVLFKDTTGCTVNGNVIPFRGLEPENLDAPAPLFTGPKRIENLGWERGESSIVIEQSQPLPFHLLSVTRKLTVND